MSSKIFSVVRAWLAILLFPVSAMGATLTGTVQYAPGAYSISYVSSDLLYIDGRTHSGIPIFLMCLDISTHAPDNDDNVEFFTNAGGAAIVGGSGEIGVAAVHWLFDHYYLNYHKNGSSATQFAFQYAVWEIGNDFDGTIGSISATAGQSNPSTNTDFPDPPDHDDFINAYTDMYDGLISALSTSTLMIGYRSNIFTIDLFQNADPKVQNMVTLIEAPPSVAADLALTKTGPASAAVGSNLVYTVTLENNGLESAFNVIVTDPTPVGLTFVSNTGSCVMDYPCSIGTLASGASATITTTYILPPDYAGPFPIVNTATLSSETPDPNPNNNSSTVTTSIIGRPTADLEVVKTGPASAEEDEQIAYTIRVVNQGPDAVPDAVLSDPTPLGLTYVSSTAPCASGFPCALPTLANGAEVTVTVIYTVQTDYSGLITNIASANSATVPDPNPNNNSSTVITSIIGQPTADLEVVKTGPASADEEEQIAYTIRVINQGPDAVPDAVLSDPTPLGLTYVSSTAPCASGFPCALPTLANGTEVTVTVLYTVQTGYSGTITNIATATSATVPDPLPDTNTGVVATVVAGDLGPPAIPLPIDTRWMLALIGLLLLLSGAYRIRSRY